MCGIYGSTFRYTDEVVNQKIQRMRFRGPDFQAFKRYSIGENALVTLGHVRLSILDLDARSNQPFEYNENISIVFNGEIYNYQELKQQYLSGVSFRTTSDTEVICALYEKLGPKCVECFNGMFAFVLLDKKRNIMFGARDRLGKKPFYYRWNADGFEFASQPDAIRLGNQFTIDAEARTFYLFNGYIPDPYSIWSELRKLRAGQCFEYNLARNELRIETYWDLFSNSCGFEKPKSYDEAKEMVKSLLEDAVKIRLRADVPVGMFLSGGIDSTLTSALVAKQQSNICAYTIGFEEEKYDESSEAAATAKYLGIPFVKTMCSGRDMLDMFSDLPTYYDEPFGDFSCIPTSLLSKVTRQNVTVAIGGDGGDELFYGYRSYMSLIAKEKLYKTLPYPLRRLIYDVTHPFIHNPKLSVLRFQSLKEGATQLEGYGGYAQASKYNAAEIAQKFPDIALLDNKSRGLLAFSDYDMKHYMNSCINTKTDRASMRFSLELRSPIMDYRVAEYSRLLPLEYLYSKDLGGKRILKDILYEIIPREMMERPKHGFAAPVGAWFRDSMRRDFVDTLNLHALQSLVPELDAQKVVSYRDNFLSSSPDTLGETAFFKIYNYLKWCQQYNGK